MPVLCPYCSSECEADFVDIGVGEQQCGPYHCEECGASQIGPYDDERELTPDEKRTHWYAPGSPPGSSANVIDNRIVTAEEARARYRFEQLYPGIFAQYVPEKRVPMPIKDDYNIVFPVIPPPSDIGQ